MHVGAVRSLLAAPPGAAPPPTCRRSQASRPPTLFLSMERGLLSARTQRAFSTCLGWSWAGGEGIGLWHWQQEPLQLA